jgi:hypothetical protein
MFLPSADEERTRQGNAWRGTAPTNTRIQLRIDRHGPESKSYKCCKSEGGFATSVENRKVRITLELMMPNYT